MSSEKEPLAIQRFDEANSKDPNLDQGRPKELIYAERMSAWLEKMFPDASDVLRLAARAQHLERWKILRKDYVSDRVGYLKWRADLKNYHAARAAEILRDVGYEEETIARCATLIKKENLKLDAEVQALEDVACLVFLENYFADFSAQHETDKVIEIVRKTWQKMSRQGHAAALSLPLSDAAKTLIEKALA